MRRPFAAGGLVARDPVVWPYTLQVIHGPQPCPKAHRGCRAVEGEVLIEVVNKTRSGIVIEASASRSRVDDPGDHAASFVAWGPDYSETYPAKDGGRDA